MAGGAQQPSQSTTQNSEPWKAAAPYLEGVMQEANGLYRDPSVGPSYFPFSTVANQSGQTTDSLNQIEGLARQGSPLPGQASNALGSMIGQGGLSTGQQQALSGLSGIAGGQQGLDADPVLAATARGEYLNGNPYLDSMLSRGAGDIGNRANAAMSKAGRYGSGAHTDVLSRNLGDYYNQAYGQEWGRARGEQMNAINAQTQVQNQNLANRMAASGQQLSGYQQGQANLMTGISMAPGVNASRYDDSKMLAGVGAAKDAYGSAQLQDDIQRWQSNAMAPWERLGMAANLFNGAGGKGVSSTSTTQGALNSTSPFVTGLGGALGGASLGNMLMPGIGTGVGALAGGALGYFR